MIEKFDILMRIVYNKIEESKESKKPMTTALEVYKLINNIFIDKEDREKAVELAFNYIKERIDNGQH